MPDRAPPIQLVLATLNRDKIREISVILNDYGVAVISPDDLDPWDEPDESGNTLEENAIIKALAVHEATGLPAVADDTGLEVSALGGAPGVWSSRYSGESATYESNCAKLLNDLGEEEDRVARFRTVVASAGLADFGIASEVLVDGVLDGTIAKESRGSEGFGYDPVFIPAGEARTLAEMSLLEKNAISHRGRAFRAFGDEVLAQISARGGIRTPTPEGTGS